MNDQKLEICQIRQVSKSGGLSISVSYVAEKTTSTGTEVIAKSNTAVSKFRGFNWSPPTEKLFGEIASELHQQVLSQLMSYGWEPSGTDKDGKVMALKRQVGTKSESRSLGPSELLQQLASLRESGILTQEEFDRKKAEILKRI